MKTLLIILVLALSATIVCAQTSRKTKNRKSIKSTTYKRLNSRKADTSTFVSNGVDSFKRSLRYTPGRPYEVKNADSIEKANVAANRTTNNINTQGSNSGNLNNTNRTNNINSTNNANNINNTNVTSQGMLGNNPNTSVGTNNNGQITTGGTNGGIGIRNVPVSPSMERNMADVNQRPLNENSKNAIEGMNAGQVNALNNNQMAPPPENWGFRQTDNWGRNTVGASQWSPGNKISEAFNRDFPGAGESVWFRNNSDSLSTMVQYRSNNNWSAAIYNSDGIRTETRVQLATNTLPDPVQFYLSSQNNKYPVRQVYRIIRPGNEDVFRVVLNTGRQVYINMQGAEVTY